VLCARGRLVIFTFQTRIPMNAHRWVSVRRLSNLDITRSRSSLKSPAELSLLSQDGYVTLPWLARWNESFAMTYKHDIFISYKRSAENNRWIEKHFEPLLKHYVEEELGRQAAVFRDDKIHDGSLWPVELGEALGHSRVLVSLWSNYYFSSAWCMKELDLMLVRERATGYRVSGRVSSLIVPCVLHDCENLEFAELKQIQRRDLSKCYNVRMRRDGRCAEKLATEIAKAAKGIAESIHNAPSWQEEWPRVNAQHMLEILKMREAPSQKKPPRF
jgi:hypothetical protein